MTGTVKEKQVKTTCLLIRNIMQIRPLPRGNDMHYYQLIVAFFRRAVETFRPSYRTYISKQNLFNWCLNYYTKNICWQGAFAIKANKLYVACAVSRRKTPKAVTGSVDCRGWRYIPKQQQIYIYHTGSRSKFSLSAPGCGHIHITAPMPRFLSGIPSSTENAEVWSAVTLLLLLISTG